MKHDHEPFHTISIRNWDIYFMLLIPSVVLVHMKHETYIKHDLFSSSVVPSLICCKSSPHTKCFTFPLELRQWKITQQFHYQRQESFTLSNDSNFKQVTGCSIVTSPNLQNIIYQYSSRTWPFFFGGCVQNPDWTSNILQVRSCTVTRRSTKTKTPAQMLRVTCHGFKASDAQRTLVWMSMAMLAQIWWWESTYVCVYLRIWYIYIYVCVCISVCMSPFDWNFIG